MSAFNRPSLERMLEFELQKSLYELVSGNSGFRHTVFELIKVAEKERWIVQLLDAAQRTVPTNTQLAKFYITVRPLVTSTVYWEVDFPNQRDRVVEPSQPAPRREQTEETKSFELFGWKIFSTTRHLITFIGLFFIAALVGWFAWSLGQDNILSPITPTLTYIPTSVTPTHTPTPPTPVTPTSTYTPIPTLILTYTQTLQPTSTVAPTRTPDRLSTFSPVAPTPTLISTVGLNSSCSIPIPRGWLLSYKVTDGDSLSSIAPRYGVSVARLMIVNCMDDSDIYVGNLLYVPIILTPTPTPPNCKAELYENAFDGPASYFVEKNDTLDQIAWLNQTTVAELMTMNCLLNSTIFVGQLLYIPSNLRGFPLLITPMSTSMLTPMPTSTSPAP